MRQLTVFNNVTVDGYFTNARGEMGWAHEAKPDKEWTDFVSGNASGGGELVFGRVTYEMMASFWPTPMAEQMDPVVAKAMNALPKVVFSRTLKTASWNNTRLFKGNLVGRMKKLKQEQGRDMVIFGSGQLVAQLAKAGLIDAYSFVVNPLALGNGRTLFDGVKPTVKLKLTKSRAFKNGHVVLTYVPA